MTLRSLALLGAVTLVVTAAQSTCSNSTAPEGDCVCTREFRLYSLTVVDDQGDPVDGVTLEVVNLRTGEALTSGFLGLATPGTYWIVDDSMIDAFSVDGDSVRVTGTKDPLSFETGLRFATDACGCHVHKVAGPDTVTIR